MRVKHCSYSVPARLIGAHVRVRVFEQQLEVWFGDQLQLSCERLLGRNQHRVDYRHVIWSQVRKPGAFSRSVYRDDMFPSVTFRKAFDDVQTRLTGIKATSTTCEANPDLVATPTAPQTLGKARPGGVFVCAVRALRRCNAPRWRRLGAGRDRRLPSGTYKAIA